MTIRGWVYVLTNIAMPGLVKIGFSMKDPVIRARDLKGTGVPHPFIVEYDVLVIEPRDVEKEVHAELNEDHESKEFFRISVEDAIRCVKEIIQRQEKKVILEQFFNPEDNQSHDPEHPLIPSNLERRDQCPICKTSLLQGEWEGGRCPNCFSILLG